MAIKMLMFETNETEKRFLQTRNFDDFNITFFSENLNADFIKTLSPEQLENTQVISIFKNSSVTRNLLNRFMNLRVLSIRAMEFDHICIETCEDKNIAVINIPHYDTRAVAQYTIGLIINLVRKISASDKMSNATEIFNERFVGRDLAKLTLGLVGTGIVGGEICKLARAFGMRVVTADEPVKQEWIDKYGLEYISTDEFRETSDIIASNIEYSPENYHLFNNEYFSKCKDGVYFINTSKSELIDLEALYCNIDSGKLGGAALDTVPCDSICEDCKTLSKELTPEHLECLEQTDYIDRFKRYDNVIITPKIAPITRDSIESVLEETINNIKETLKGDKMCRIV